MLLLLLPLMPVQQVAGASPVERDLSSVPSAVDPSSASPSRSGDSAAGTRTVYGSVSAGVYSRPPTSSGGRNMQDSSFSLSAMSDS